ncbi:MAG: peptidase domain protein [Myxococcales bacterium]|nr:peptidase domain protein [Myxococcales bacterium]
MRTSHPLSAVRCVIGAVLLSSTAAMAQAPTKEVPPPTTTPTTLPPGDKGAAPKSASKEDPNPWAGRGDLYVPPNMTPTTKVNLGQVGRATLPSGMMLISVPRHQIPAVDVTLAVRTPDTAEPTDKTGVAQFVATMLRKGTQRRTADQISDAIDFVGGAISAQAAGGGIYVSCHARTRDLALCLDLLADVAMNATFPESEMDQSRDELMSTVNGVKDNPQSLATWHAANVFFGDDDPRGRPMSKRSLESIDRKALVEYRDRWFAPNNAILAISGDIDDKTARPLINKSFGAWKKKTVPPLTDPPARPMASAKVMPVRLVDKPDATQSTVVVIGPGIKHADPQFYAIRLMNYALGGGGFSSRLMKVVRSEGGKTYGVRSSFDAGREAGPFHASTFTRNAETAATLKIVLAEIAKMRETGPTEEELKAAKSNLIGGYGLRLETGADLAEELIGAEVDGLDSKYVAEYPARLEAVTLEKAATAAAQHLDPRALVIVGKAADVGPMLKKAGYSKIEVVNYLDPVSVSERKALLAQRSATAEVLPAEAMEGRRLLELNMQARGGQAALAKVLSLQMTGKGMLSMQGQQVPVTVDTKEIRGKATREDIDMGGMQVTQVYAEGKGYLKQGDRRMDMPPDMKLEMQKAVFRDPNFIVLNAIQEKGAKVRGLKTTTEGGVSYETVEIISPEGDVFKLLLDPKTHHVARMLYAAEGHQIHDELADYRVVEGVSFPFKYKHEAGPQKVEIDYDKIVVNPKLSPDVFK